MIIIPPDMLKEQEAASMLNGAIPAAVLPAVLIVMVPPLMLKVQVVPALLIFEARLNIPPSTITEAVLFGIKVWSAAFPIVSVPAETRSNPAIVQFMAEAFRVPPLHHSPAVLGIK